MGVSVWPKINTHMDVEQSLKAIASNSTFDT